MSAYFVEGKVYFYTGRKGSGKTLTIVKDAINYKANGWTVYSNFKIEGVSLISNKDILELDKKSDIRDCVLVVDEIQVLFDSRKSMKSENVSFSNFLQQIRKRGIILLCSTQYSGTVDLRLRQHVDVEVKPKYYKEYGVCEAIYTDLNTIDDYNPYPEQVSVAFFGRDVFCKYDTRETIV